MSDGLMASTDVSNRLEGIEKRIDKQDELLGGVNESLKELVRVTERQVSLSEKVADLNLKLDKMDARITANHDKITRWAGMGAAIVALVGFMATCLTLYVQLSQ